MSQNLQVLLHPGQTGHISGRGNHFEENSELNVMTLTLRWRKMFGI